MGARIAGLGTHVLTIEGGALLGGAVHTVLPDRIEFGTLACAAALTDGELVLPQGRVDLLGSAAASFAAAGIELQRDRRWRDRPAGQGRPGRRRSHDRALSRLRDRPAGSDDGAAGCGRRERARSPKAFSSSASAMSTNCERWVQTSPFAAARRGSGASSACTVPPSPAPKCARQRPSSWPGLGLREKQPSTASTIWIAATMDGGELAACGADIARR